MDDLTQARVELALLEEKAQELLTQLLEVRTAVSAQRTKIRELIRQRSPPIYCLPTELLVSILNLDIRALPYHQRNWELARVSRHWRDVILDNPIFWTTINLLTLSTSAIKTHLERSGDSPLDIVIEANGPPASIYDKLIPRMHIVTPHIRRWRALDVSRIWKSYGSGEALFRVGELIGGILDYCPELPSLKRAIIPCFGSIAYPNYLSSICIPSLEHLELDDCQAWEDFEPPPTLKTLRLAFEASSAQYPSFLYLIPTQALTTLSLSGVIDEWILQPNSICFPVLKTLVLSVSRTNKLMRAIVALNLEHLDYLPDYEDVDDYPASPSVIFRGLGRKFASVRHLSFFGITKAEHFFDHDPSALRLFKVFPNVHHAEVTPQDLNGLLMDYPCTPESTHDSYLIDLWKDLHCLTLRGPSDEWFTGLDQLPAWLMQRRTLGLRPLHIRLTEVGRIDSSVNVADYFGRLHNCLRDYCHLEFNISTTVKMNLSTAVDSSLVSTLYLS
ncbi:hypothetical protein V8B97DRAFT_1874498 [Scleroderma yunnanense]